MKRQKNISQMKEKEKFPQNPKEVESSHLSNKKFKGTIIRVLIKFESGLEELRENFNEQKV